MPSVFTIILTIAVASITVYGSSFAATTAKARPSANALLSPRTLEEAKQWVRQAQGDNLGGRHENALRLARAVFERYGDVRVFWAGPGARHFGIDVNDPFFKDKMMILGGELAFKISIDISGASAWEELVDAHYGKRDWKSVVTILEAELLKGRELGDGAVNRLTIARQKLALQGQVMRPLYFVNRRGGYAEPEKGNRQLIVAIEDFAKLSGAKLRGFRPGKEISFALDGHQLTVSIGQATAIVDGKAVGMGAVPRISEGKHLVPLQFLTEALKLPSRSDDRASIVFVSVDKSSARAGESS